MLRHGGDIYRNQVDRDHSVNLNPMGTPEEVVCAMRESLSRADVYPDPAQAAVRRAIADQEGVSDDRVIAGSGASELLLAAVRALRPGRALLPEPAFTGYSHVLDAVGCRINRVSLPEADGFRLTGQALSPLWERATDPAERELLILCDPSNPAGANIDEEVLLSVLDRAHRQGIAVILDESFFLLSDKAEDADPERTRRLIDRYDRLILIRSLTKLFAVPGIRAGYAVSAQENIERIRAQLPEWNLSAVSEAAITAGCRVLAETDFAERSRELIRTERAYLAGHLREAGCTVCPSEAPYLLLQGPEDLDEALLKRRILIRACGDFPGLGPGWFRVAVRDRASNEILVRNVREVAEERHGI